ncbi:TonB-dependent receptor domain-containing protein [Kordiimonas laminariae]|uniref:TonB-dependent receptor domain-containing protein n=1 Tax=Kordiimonas laminariae TaxID=2917717 RepID=UPI001FF543FE|nr:TonB-dependent receptor [Kordiimonas laminariae]
MIDNLSLFRRAALLGSTAAIAMGMCSVSVAAQDADDTEVEEVVVTGSRISRPNITSSSPVTVLEAEAFDILGAVDTIDLVNQLPQAFVAQDSSFANGANGTSTLNLRGLGAIRTLVLANGKRLPYGSPTQGGIPSDINLIPAQLVERVEIITGGASAVYGSDAIGGVANFILKRDFEGIELDALYGFNQSNNSSDFARQALEDLGEDPVQGSVTDNSTIDISGVIGANLDDGRGNVTAYFRYLDSNGTQQGDRDFARCALGEFGGDPFCLGSNQGPFPTTFVLSPVTSSDGEAIGGGSFSLNQDGSLSSGFNNAFNFNPFNPVRRAIERINAGFSGRYNVTDNIEAYADFGYTRSNSPQIIAPSAAFGSSINQVNCDNPLLGDNLATICGTVDSNGNFSRDPDGDGFVQAEVRRRFVEGGPRTDDRTLANYRLVYGLRGELDDNWNWDAFGQLGRTDLARLQFNQVTRANLANSLDIVADANGNPVCRSVVDGTDPACIPFTTAFDPNATVDADALRQYVDTPTLTQGSITQTVFGGTINGDLTDYGLATPWADDGVAVLFGFEFRRDGLRTQADGTNQSGSLVGSGGAVLPTNGETEVYDFFTEVQVPIIQGADFAKELTLTGAYRRSEYSSTDILNNVEGGDFGADAYSLGISWAPVDDIRFRVQYQRAVRAANIGELFLPQNTNLTSLSDPCAGFAGTDDAPTATAAACANTGVTAAQFGAIPPDSGQLNVLVGGNPNLQPETSDTFTVGVVIQPEAIPGLSVSVDYYNIDITDVVSTIPASFTLQRCLDTGDAQFCNLINRGPDGSLTFFPREQANIVTTNTNIGAFKTSGLDWQVAYNFGIGEDWGDLALSYVATYQFENTSTPLPGAGTFDCVGFFDQGCGNPTFTYRHIVNANWQTPWDVTVAANWRYFAAVDRISSIDTDTGEITTFADEGNGELTSATLEAQHYFDLTVFWDATENVQLRAGVRNVFDNDPPVLPAFGPSPTANVEANTVAGVYEAGGRFIFFGAKFSF